ncbi:MAG: hypothetical protein AAFY41_12255 [Bacteroidota bacterium]
MLLCKYLWRDRFPDNNIYRFSFFLVDELFKQEGKTINIVIGKPILPEVFNKERTDYEWAQWVKNEVYKLKQA